MSLLTDENQIDIDSSEFYFFISWLVNEYRQDPNCKYNMTEEDITNRLLDIIQSPHKFIKEMKEFRNARTS